MGSTHVIEVWITPEGAGLELNQGPRWVEQWAGESDFQALEEFRKAKQGNACVKWTWRGTV